MSDESDVAVPQTRTGPSASTKSGRSAWIAHPAGLEYTILGLTCGLRVSVRSCTDLVLAGEPVENRSATNLVVGEVDRFWGLGFGLGRCELPQRLVWPRESEMRRAGHPWW